MAFIIDCSKLRRLLLGMIFLEINSILELAYDPFKTAIDGIYCHSFG